MVRLCFKFLYKDGNVRLVLLDPHLSYNAE